VTAVTTVAQERLGPRILTRPEHPISRRNISREALKVLYRLQRSGYLAYLVGGSVRDLMIGRTPKDFDVATNARPREIRSLFRNSRTIGRRFRLVHVFFRDEVVEVATFRASPEPPEGPDDWEEAEQEAMEADAEEVRRAPLPEEPASFGTPEEDARRRDFTINALFYDISDFSVLDYVGGIDDLHAGMVRTIGDPDTRFQEDPVRMMRALEYSIRLGFELDPETADAIGRNSHGIQSVSGARLTYELFEALRSGAATGIIDAWCRAGLVELAFPNLRCTSSDTARLLQAVDRRIAEGGRLADSSLIGAFFLARFFAIVGNLTGEGAKIDNVELLQRLHDLLAPTAADMHLSNLTVHLLHQGLFTLTKMTRPPERGRQVVKLSRQDYFPVAWDLHGLATTAEFMAPEAHEAWARALLRVQQGGPVEEIVSNEEGAPRRRRRRRPRRGRRRR
jgi:poly(A) polymerase